MHFNLLGKAPSVLLQSQQVSDPVTGLSSSRCGASGAAAALPRAPLGCQILPARCLDHSKERKGLKKKKKGGAKKICPLKGRSSVLLPSRPGQLAQGDRCHMTDNSRARQSSLRWEQPRSIHVFTHAYTETCVPTLLEGFFPHLRQEQKQK